MAIEKLRHFGKGKKPAPTLAWEVIHGKPYPGQRMGRAPGTKEKLWKGLYVDEHLDNNWLEKLNSIKNVEIRSSCEGHGPEGGISLDWPTFIIFRVDTKLEPFVEKIVAKLNSFKNTKSGYDIGMEGRPRICVAAPLYYNCKKQKEWEDWWKNLPGRINVSVNKQLF